MLLRRYRENTGKPVKEEPVKEEPVKEEPVKEEPVKEDKPLDNMTVKELMTYAAEKGIDLEGLTKKGDILSKIKG